MKAQLHNSFLNEKIAANNMRPLTKSLETFVCDHCYSVERGLCEVKEIHDQTGKIC